MSFMVSEQLKQRGIRIVNLKIGLHKELTLMKINKDFKSLSSVIATLLEFYKKRYKKYIVGVEE